MANLIINLPQLQDKIKRDPTGYKDEFNAQFLRYKTSLELAQLYPDNDNEQLIELMNFLASISHCYPEVMVNKLIFLQLNCLSANSLVDKLLLLTQ